MNGLIFDLKHALKSPKKFIAKTSVDTAQIRGDLIARLLEAVDQVYSQAKAIPPLDPKAKGHASEKQKWLQKLRVKYFQLIGHLAQVLDGILENVELDEMAERVARLEEYNRALKGEASSQDRPVREG